MRKPDRLERMVDAISPEDKVLNGPAMLKSEAITLLRRERARLRRKVRALPAEKAYEILDDLYLRRDDVLAIFKEDT